MEELRILIDILVDRAREILKRMYNNEITCRLQFKKDVFSVKIIRLFRGFTKNGKLTVTGSETFAEINYERVGNTGVFKVVKHARGTIVNEAVRIVLDMLRDRIPHHQIYETYSFTKKRQ